VAPPGGAVRPPGAPEREADGHPLGTGHGFGDISRFRDGVTLRRAVPWTPEAGIKRVTPEELDRERKASLERQRKQLEKNAAERVPQERTETKVLSRAQRLKLRDDEFVPPQE
jgi:hypothetical protein